MYKQVFMLLYTFYMTPLKYKKYPIGNKSHSTFLLSLPLNDFVN